jgi:hypothetical protein
MIRIEPGNATLGARVTGVDLAHSLSDADFASVLRALAQYGVLCFPNQPIEAAALQAFSARFGGLQAMSSGNKDRGEPGMPEVSILSNVVENGRHIGIPDAGQDWHTDMTSRGSWDTSTCWWQEGAHSRRPTAGRHRVRQYTGGLTIFPRGSSKSYRRDRHARLEPLPRDHAAQGSKRPALTEAQRRGGHQYRIPSF